MQSLIGDFYMNLVKTVSFRIPAEVHKQFLKKADLHGGASHVAREILTAFVENRLTIAPPKKNALFDYES